MWRDYQWHRNHRLAPVAGGLLEQPSRWVAAVEIIDAELAKLEKVKPG